MAGRVQLEISGPQDAFFTDDPEYTYFVKNFQKHTNFAPFFKDLDVEGEMEFGNTIRCTIPQDQGDLLKTVSLKFELSSIQQNLVSWATGLGYVESIGHAIIEYAEILIGGKTIQRIPSDFLAIYFDNYVSHTKQENLGKLIGKPPGELSGTRCRHPSIAGYLGNATSNQKFFVDIPFYFYNNPELAIPVFAIDKQEIEIVIKLRERSDCIIGYKTSDPDYVFYTGDLVTTKGLIKDMKITTEMVSLVQDEKDKIKSKKINYAITQIQEVKNRIPQDANNNNLVHTTHRLDFKHPVKELFFIIQRMKKTVNSWMVTNFDYDSEHQVYAATNLYTNQEHLQNLSLTLDDTDVISGASGEIINLRAVQSGVHHTRTQLCRRYYSYSFALEPERWYPTGQVNFSLIKDQILKLTILPDQDQERELRVLAQSYNILQVENGIAKLLY
tara:strand:+ start:964 stop:2292 length:1329 start_codon:yes stop_codon:yes gene_type:complete